MTGFYQGRRRNKPKLAMKLESIKPATPRERQLRRKAHSIAFLKGITMRQMVFDALELWIEKHDTADSTKISKV